MKLYSIIEIDTLLQTLICIIIYCIYFNDLSHSIGF